VLAIDPGSRKLGWAVVVRRGQALERLASGTLRLDQKAALPERLGAILLEMQRLFDVFRPEALAIESAFVHENPHTALVLGQARGLPIAVAATRQVPVTEFPPASVKRMIVGSGRAEKHQVQAMVQIQLQLASVPQEDEADALAVAIAYHRQPAAQTGAAATPAQQAWLAAVAQAKRKSA
jgi:crossover junction endodeoxyribonuclease RuvC